MARMIRAPRPRVVSVRRRRPGQVSPGDTAEVRLDAGLIAFLEPLGAGYHARYNVPASLPATAALAVLAPTTAAGANWAGRDLEVEWLGVPGPHDAVVAEARLEEFRERLARFAIGGRTQADEPLFRGTLRMIAIRDGCPAGFRSREEYQGVREKIGREKVGRERIGEAASADPAVSAGGLRVAGAPAAIPLGRTACIELEVSGAEPVTVTGQAPFGGGLSFDSPTVVQAQDGRARFQVRADRPHEVNLGRPWELVFAAGGDTVTVSILVPDPNPGRTFYLLTEDCETFDGGPLTGNYGGSEGLGNHNNFMDPEDYRVQMIAKPDRLNQIAERYGARWTHFYAATQRFGAEWAARQSRTGEWDRVIAEMDAAVRAGSERHEYAPHIHFDYEPDSGLPPQPRLVYDAATDGILPNDYYHPETNPTHCYHDWDGSARGISYIKKLGDWSELDSKAGSLRKSMRHLARLQANWRAPLVARTGSYDFGKAAEDQAISTQAFEANGLRGNSDAYRPGAAPSPGGQMFWGAERDRQKAIGDLREARLVELGITMDSGFHSAAEMDRWFAGEREACRGPGVHAILFTTHAMFFAGQPDPFRSLEGGAFEQFERHLAWVREQHPEVEFATASEALLEYLDYYTPALEAYTVPLLCGGDPAGGRYEFPVRLLGQGIRVDEERPATVRIAAPACFSPDELLEMRVTQDGREVAAGREFDARREAAVTAKLTSRAGLRVMVVLRPEAVAAALASFGEIVFHDPPESAEDDLMRLRTPGDVARLLMHPVAGNAEPLGRRIHPLGGLTLGAALSAALPSADDVPVRMKLRWLKEVDLAWNYVAEAQSGTVRVRDGSGALVAQAEVVVRKAAAPAMSAPPVPACIPASLREWERDFEAALAVYRQQRAWKVMLAVRKIYDVLRRGSWKQRAGLLRPGALGGLEKYELEFPRPGAYVGDGEEE